MKFTVKDRAGDADLLKNGVPINLDGEPWLCKKFYTIEVIPDGVEYMFDPKYFTKNNSFI
jgi:hypothetical protein